MNSFLKPILAAALMLGGAQIVYAQAAAPAAAPATNSGIVAPGIGVANVDAVVGNSLAFKVAQQQRPVTYKAQFDAANARRAQITAQLQPMVDRFNRERSAATANTPTAQASLQQQAQTIQGIQEAGQAELQKILEPVAMSEAYVQEQINDKISQAIQSAMAKKRITLLLTPQTVVAASNSYNLNQTILDDLNALIPSATLVPPAGWLPREVREQQAAQGAPQGAAPAGQRPAAPPPLTRPAPGGR
jgi:Skp family chaperone for outer membrane proteins